MFDTTQPWTRCFGGLLKSLAGMTTTNSEPHESGGVKAFEVLTASTKQIGGSGGASEDLHVDGIAPASSQDDGKDDFSIANSEMTSAHNYTGTNKTENEDDATDEPSKLYEHMLRNPITRFCVTRFPRTCALFTAVLLPLFALVLLSVTFGVPLCQYEAPEEVAANNYALEQIYFANMSAEAISNLTVVLPRLCFILYLRNNTLTTIGEVVPAAIAELFANSTMTFPSGKIMLTVDKNKLLDLPDDLKTKSKVVDTEELFLFLKECRDIADDALEDRLQQSITYDFQVSYDLSFTWIRCYQGADGSISFRGSQLTPQQRSEQGQTDWYTQTWESDRKRLFQKYYEQLLQDGVTQSVAYTAALEEAARDANGGTECNFNAPAAAWFWFTVQTTIGYGNQAPTSVSGRAMVFTIGFVSILAFASVLASTGDMVSFMFDDFVTRNGMNILALPWVACILWSVAYYAWMLLIAKIVVKWKMIRLGETFSLSDSYWFSYISTTTVGFGDYVLDPEGIVGADLAYFPLLFLCGLMILALFFGKLSALIYQVARRGRKSFVNTLLEKRVAWKHTFSMNIEAS